MKQHLNIKVYGAVQGVFYRAFAEKEANALGLFGFAENMPDGSVYIEIEGGEPAIREFLKLAQKGPLGAKIEKIEALPAPLQNFTGFKIKF